jgi:NarL family two-component system response regulator LiaR
LEAVAATQADLRVVVVLKHTLPRLGLVRLLEGIDGTRVVAHAGTAAEGARLASEFASDVVLVDAELADDDNMQIVETLKERSATTHVLLVADEVAQTQVERALEAGADGYTLKDISVQELASTIRRLADGDTVLHPDAASSLARRFSANGKGKSVPLTPRQREILRLIAAGLENKQIARRLGIGVHTVKTHVSRVLNKLGASSRTEAVVLALRDRLIS